MMILTQPPTAGERTAWGRAGIAICCFRTQAVRVVERVRRELEPDDMCTYVRDSQEGREARREWLRAILVALSMPSAGLGEPELDVARAWGWPGMSLPALLLLLLLPLLGVRARRVRGTAARWCHIGHV